MPDFRFTLTVPATMSAQVVVSADTIEKAQDIALQPHFFQDPALARFELDEGNILQDAYLPDEDDYEIVDPAEPAGIDDRSLHMFWRESDLVNDFFETHAVGVSPAGAVFDGKRIVIANGQRDLLAGVVAKNGAYVALGYADALHLADPEAETEELLSTTSPEEAFRAAAAHVGHALDDANIDSAKP